MKTLLINLLSRVKVVHVADGTGMMLVLSVGVNSFQGRLWALLNEEETHKTSLQEKLEVLATQIGLAGIIAAGLSFIVLLLPWLYKCFFEGVFSCCCSEPLSFFIVSLTVIACAVHEGLLFGVTISLAYSMRQMMTDNSFVRRMCM